MPQPILIFLSLILLSVPYRARAQNHFATSTSTSTLYGSDDIRFLESELSKAQQAFESALSHWNANDASDPKAQTLASRNLQTAEARVEHLKRTLEKARKAPLRKLVLKRTLYNLKWAALKELHQQLAPRGDLYRELIVAQRKLANLIDARSLLMRASEEPSFILERLSALEKLDEQLTATEEQLAMGQRLHEQLNDDVFERFVRYETAVAKALKTYEQLQDIWKSIANSPRARAYEYPAPTPSDIAQLVLFSQEGKDPGIIELWLTLSGQAYQPHEASILRYRGQLAEYQREIDQRRFIRDRIQSDAERLRTLEADHSRSELSSPESSAFVVPDSNSEYARLGRQIHSQEKRLEDLRQEQNRLTELLAEVETSFEDQRLIRRRGRFTLEKHEFELSENERMQPLLIPSPKGPPKMHPRIMYNFVFAERVASEREHLGDLGRSARRTEIRRDVLRRRLNATLEEYKGITSTDLPRLRRTYYLTVAETAGDRGVRVLIVLLLAYSILWVLRQGSGELIEAIVEQTLRRQGVEVIREQRARTLISVFIGAGRFFIYALAVLFVVGQLDIDYGPLLVAAGGLSLAVGFGAQALVRDFFAGFFILLEGQYSIGDVVDINGKAGIVEDLNLRTTILRSIDGEVHTIPNGEITITTNKTKFWSRAVVDISVAYEENIDEIIGVLGRIAEELRIHEHWAQKIRKVEVLGIEELLDSAVIIRVLIETSPGQQWAISREFRRRVKVAFHDLNIEIPWPQRVVTQKSAYPSVKKVNDKHLAIRKYIGALIEETTDNSPPLSIEERDRAEAIANKEASILEKQQKNAPEEDETEEPSFDPPTLLDARNPLERLEPNPHIADKTPKTGNQSEPKDHSN